MPLGVVPVGTANDFARALGLPVELARPTELAGDRRPDARASTSAAVGERPFVNAASAGLSPVAAREAHGLKRALGALAYAVGALRAGLSRAPVAARVASTATEVFDGERLAGDRRLTGAFGGGAEVDADPADGALDVVVIEAGSRARLVAPRLRAARRAGRGAARACSPPAGPTVEVETDGETGFNVDGELIGDARLRFDASSRGAFELVVGR